MLHFMAKLSLPSESGFEGGGLWLTPCNGWEFTHSHHSVFLSSKRVVKMLLLGVKSEAVFQKPYEVLVVFFYSLSAHQYIAYITLRFIVSLLPVEQLKHRVSPNGRFLKLCLPKSTGRS